MRTVLKAACRGSKSFKPEILPNIKKENQMPTIFITGAGRGIGLELARVYAASGYHVIASVRNIAEAKSVLSFAELIELEVTDPASVAALHKFMENKTIDVLINNAGIIGPDAQSTTEMDFDGFMKTLEVNTVAPLRIVQAVLPALRRAKEPKLATISSKMGSLSYAPSDHVAYRASKAAANKVIQCLATDFKPLGIAVASLHPGWVKTDMGGEDADIDVKTSAAGIKSVIDRLSLATTGRFWNYDGSKLDW
jgi:NAD(P)-dependent dehydrogenase (short-subunit alcohol dehydrogenase family)